MHTFKPQTAQEKIWRYLRNKRSGTLDDIILAIQDPREKPIHRKSVCNYLARLRNDQYLSQLNDRYILINDTGPETPRTDYKRKGVVDPNLLENLKKLINQKHPAAPPTKPLLWEYLILISPDVTTLNRSGKEGWELVAVSGEEYILKRPTKGGI